MNKIVFFCLLLSVALPLVVARARCWDPINSKFVDRWFMLTEPYLRDNEANLDRKQFGFVWMVATTRDEKLQTPQAMLYNTKLEARLEIEYIFLTQKDERDAQFWFNDLGRSSTSVPNEFYSDLQYKGMYINRAHSKWMISIGSDSGAFIILHSWPGPDEPAKLLNFNKEESFQNTQHAFCFSVDEEHVFPFLEGALSTFPALRHTNVDLNEDSYLYKSIIQEFVAKDNYGEAELLIAQRCLEAHFLTPNDHTTCSDWVPGPNWNLITNLPLPRFFDPEQQQGSPQPYNPAKLIPFPWIAALQQLNTEHSAGLNIMMLLEWSPPVRGPRTLPSVPSQMVYLASKMSIPIKVGQDKYYMFPFRKGQGHAKIGVFLQSPTDETNGVVCFGDANHVASISLKAGMEVCFDEPFLAKMLFQSSEMECTSPREHYIKEQQLTKFSGRQSQLGVWTSEEKLRILLPRLLLQEAAMDVENNNNQVVANAQQPSITDLNVPAFQGQTNDEPDITIEQMYDVMEPLLDELRTYDEIQSMTIEEL